MEEQNRINDPALTELEKDVLDEYILDIKNLDAVIPLHEENNREKYDRIFGKGASLKLFTDHMDYIVQNGVFNEEQSQRVNDMVKWKDHL